MTKKSPHLHDGRIEGDVVVIEGKNVDVKSDFVLDGALKVVGSPKLDKIKGEIGSQRVGTGPASPTKHKVSVHKGSYVKVLETSTEVLKLPEVVKSPKATGKKKLKLKPGQTVSDFFRCKRY